jgi:hypothetical protein
MFVVVVSLKLLSVWSMFRDEGMDVRPPSYRQRFVKEVWLWSEASESYSIEKLMEEPLKSLPELAAIYER